MKREENYCVVRLPLELQVAGRAVRTAGGAVDWQGFTLVALTLGCLQVVLDRGQEYDWFASHLVTVLSIISATAFLLLIWWQVPHQHPMVNLRLLGRRDFGTASPSCSALVSSSPAAPTCCRVRAVSNGLPCYRCRGNTDARRAARHAAAVIGQIVNKVDLPHGRCWDPHHRRLLLVDDQLYLDISFKVLVPVRMVQFVGMAFLFRPSTRSPSATYRRTRSTTPRRSSIWPATSVAASASLLHPHS